MLVLYVPVCWALFFRANASPAVSVAAQIADDMRGRNEGLPHGVPLTFEWATKPAMSMGNNAAGSLAITAWGAIYEAAEGNEAANTRVKIRNMQTLYLSKKTAAWLVLQSTNSPEGAAYREDFSGNANKPAPIRHEPDGTISVTAGNGFNFHFYPSPRAAMDPSDLAGIVVVLQARLIVNDPAKRDDRSKARYLCGAGADYYPALTGGWPGTASFNPGVALGKMKYVKPEWRSFAMTTLPLNELEKNPPPVDLREALP